jgi:hypothetical protein
MIPNGFELVISNDYGFELDSFLGAIYLPWHTIAITTALLISVGITNNGILRDRIRHLWVYVFYRPALL